MRKATPYLATAIFWSHSLNCSILGYYPFKTKKTAAERQAYINMFKLYEQYGTLETNLSLANHSFWFAVLGTTRLCLWIIASIDI